MIRRNARDILGLNRKIALFKGYMPFKTIHRTGLSDQIRNESFDRDFNFIPDFYTERQLNPYSEGWPVLFLCVSNEPCGAGNGNPEASLFA